VNITPHTLTAAEEFEAVLAQPVHPVDLPMGKLSLRDRIDAACKRVFPFAAAVPVGLLFAAGVLYR
jgi:hypothetical protein